MNLLDINKVFSLKLNIPLLDGSECSKVLGYNMDIKSQPIRKIVQFKESVEDKPQKIWKAKWNSQE